MQINIDFNLLNSIIQNSNVTQSLGKEGIDFEALLASSLDKQDGNLESDLIINTKDLDIDEEEISKIISLLNQLINKDEVSPNNSLDIDEMVYKGTINNKINFENSNKDLDMLNDIAKNDFQKINFNMHSENIYQNDNSVDTQNNQLHKIMEVLSDSKDLDQNINLIYKSIKNIDSQDNKRVNIKNTNLNSIIDKLIKQYDNKEMTGFNDTLKELASELNKISLNNSLSIDKSLNSMNVFNVGALSLDNININKESTTKELEILDDIANNDELGKLNFNTVDKKINNPLGQTHNIQTPSYKTMELNVVQDTIKSIEYMKSNNIQELNVSLNPKELGEMNIKLLQESDGMKAILTVHSKEVFDLVNKNIADIKGHLENTNINVKDVVINIKSDNTYNNESFERNFSNNQNTREQKNKNNKRNSNINDETIKEMTKEDNINLLV